MKTQIYIISLYRKIDENAVDTLYVHTYKTFKEYDKVFNTLVKTFDELGLLVDAYGNADKDYKFFKAYIEIK